MKIASRVVKVVAMTTVLALTAGPALAAPELCLPKLDPDLLLSATTCAGSTATAHQLRADSEDVYYGPVPVSVAGTSLQPGVPTSNKCTLSVNGINFSATKSTPSLGVFYDMLVLRSPGGKESFIPIGTISGNFITYDGTYSPINGTSCLPAKAGASGNYDNATAPNFPADYAGGSVRLIHMFPMSQTLIGTRDQTYCDGSGGGSFGAACASAATCGGAACRAPDFQYIVQEVQHDLAGEFNTVVAAPLTTTSGTWFSQAITLQAGVNRIYRMQTLRNAATGRIERVDTPEVLTVNASTALEHTPAAVINNHMIKAAFSGGFNQPWGVARDLNGDGLEDILIADKSRGVSYFRNEGAGSEGVYEFSKISSDLVKFQGCAECDNVVPALGDVTGDGRLDLVMGYSNGTMKVFENISVYDGSSQLVGPLLFNPLPGHALTTISSTSRAAPELVDFDADGDQDLLLCTGNQNLLVYRNSGGAYSVLSTAVVAPQLTTSNGFKYNCVVRAGAINGDGLYDFSLSYATALPHAYVNVGSAASPVWRNTNNATPPPTNAPPAMWSNPSNMLLPLKETNQSVCMNGVAGSPTDCTGDASVCGGAPCLQYSDLIILENNGRNYSAFRSAPASWPGAAAWASIPNSFGGGSWAPILVMDFGKKGLDDLVDFVAGDYQPVREIRVCSGGSNPGANCTLDPAVCTGGGTCGSLTSGLRACEGGGLHGSDCTSDSSACLLAGGQCRTRHSDAVARADLGNGAYGNIVFRGERYRCVGGPVAGKECLADADCGGGDCRTEGASVVPALDGAKACDGGSAHGADCSFDASICTGGSCVLEDHDFANNQVVGERYVMVDLDGDGDLDFVTPSTESAQFIIYENCDTRYPGSACVTGTTPNPPPDYNIEGGFDYLLTRFRVDNSQPSGGGPFSIGHSDFNSDGLSDLWVTRDNVIRYYYHTGDVTSPYCFSPGQPFASADCKLNNTNGDSLANPNTFPVVPTYVKTGTVMDINGDGLEDLVYINENYQLIAMRNQGTAASPDFTTQMMSRQLLGLKTSSSESVAINAMDLNRDGDRDFWVTDSYGGVTMFIRNDSAPKVSFITQPQVVSVADGWIEIYFQVQEKTLDTVSVRVDYSLLGSGVYQPATMGALLLAPAGTYLDNTASICVGGTNAGADCTGAPGVCTAGTCVVHQVASLSTTDDPAVVLVRWDAALDLGLAFNGQVQIRLTATDSIGEQGTADSNAVAVNLAIPWSQVDYCSSIASPGYQNGGAIIADFSAKNNRSHAITLKVRKDGAASYSNAAVTGTNPQYTPAPYGLTPYYGTFSVPVTPGSEEGLYEFYTSSTDPASHCVGGTNAGAYCTIAANCPGGTCTPNASATETDPLDGPDADALPDPDCWMIYDVTKPVVTLDSPANGVVIGTGGDMVITGTVNDINFFGSGSDCLTIVGNVSTQTFCSSDPTPKVVWNIAPGGASGAYTLTLTPADIVSLFSGSGTFQVLATDRALNTSDLAGSPTVDFTVVAGADNLALTYPVSGDRLTLNDLTQAVTGTTSGISPITIYINGVPLGATGIAGGIFNNATALGLASLTTDCNNTIQAVSANGGDTGLISFCYTLAGPVTRLRVKVISIGARTSCVGGGVFDGLQNKCVGGAFQDRASELSGTFVEFEAEPLDAFGNGPAVFNGPISWTAVGGGLDGSNLIITTPTTARIQLKLVPANFDGGATTLEGVGLMRASIPDLHPVSGLPIDDFSGVIESLKAGAGPASTPMTGVVRKPDRSFMTRQEFQMVGFIVPVTKTLNPFNVDPTWRLRSDRSPLNGYDEATGTFTFNIASLEQTWAAGDRLYLRFNNGGSGEHAWYVCPLDVVAPGAAVPFSSICCPVRWANIAGTLTETTSCDITPGDGALMGDALVSEVEHPLVSSAIDNLNRAAIPAHFGAVIRLVDLQRLVPSPSQASVYDNVAKQPHSVSTISNEKFKNALIEPGAAVELRVTGNSVWP